MTTAATNQIRLKRACHFQMQLAGFRLLREMRQQSSNPTQEQVVMGRRVGHQNKFRDKGVKP